MKQSMILGGLVALTLARTAVATIVVDQNWTVNQMLPDGNPAGYATWQTFSGLDAGAINEVDVRLNISGGYNGDLYGYLVLQSDDSSTTTSILLNRVGRTDSSGFGYSTSGFNVMLSGDTGSGYANIHGVQNPVTDNSTKYLADGRTLDPNGNFAGSSSTAGLEVLNGKNANGIWTLFLADVASGDQSTLVSWGLNISVVPEPITWALMGFGGVVSVVCLIRRRSDAGKKTAGKIVV